MGIRFRRTVKILPGVKVNISNSGPSLTLGPRGFTHTIGKSGIWQNIGLPGTGLSYRHKLADLPGSKSSGGKSGKSSGGSAPRGTSSASKALPRDTTPAAVRELMAYTGERDPRFSIGIADEGAVTIYDSSDQPISDPQLISIIKRTPAYKEQLPVAREQHRLEVAERVEQVNAASDAFVEIFRYAPPVLDRADFESGRANLRPEGYQPQPYPVPAPTEKDVRARLEAEASREARASALGNERMQEEYVRSRLADRLDLETQLWEVARAEHEQAELQKAGQVDPQQQEDFEEVRRAFDAALAGDPDYIEEAAEEWIAELDLPVEIFTQFEYREQDGCLMIDLDLPEIEDLPAQVATQLANGDLRMRDKTQTQLRKEYARCVFGLAVFVAANLLNTSPEVRETVVSGYTQRRDRAGDLHDDYLFSIRLPRRAFDGVDYATMDPEEFCLGLESRCSMTATKLFKAIEPYE